jgi:hypothetical protein
VLGAVLVALGGCGGKEGTADRTDGSGNGSGDGTGGYISTVVKSKNLGALTASRQQLRNLYSALRTHAEMNDGRFPADLEAAAKAGLIGRKALTSPAPGHSPYQYIPGQTTDMDGRNVILYEAKPYHEGRCCLTRLDGTVEDLPAEEVKAAVAKTRQNLKEQ